MEAEKVFLQEHLQTAQSDVAASQSKMIHLQTVLETTQVQLKEANESINIMSQPVATSTLVDVADATTNMSSSGELTTATGVKVVAAAAVPSQSSLPQPPPSTVVSKISNNNNDDDEEEEGWGDDWD